MSSSTNKTTNRAPGATAGSTTDPADPAADFDFDRGAIGLGVIALASLLFRLHGFSSNRDYSFVLVQGLGLLLILVIGVLAVLGGVTKQAVLVTAAGAISGVAAVIQLVQLGRHTNWVDGNASTYTLLFALALGLLVLGLGREPKPGRPG